MNILLVVSLGFIIGSFSGYYFFPFVENISQLSEVAQLNIVKQHKRGTADLPAITEYSSIRDGVLEELNIPESFLIIKYKDPINQDSFKKIKIFFDTKTVFKHFSISDINMLGKKLILHDALKIIESAQAIHISYVNSKGKLYAFNISTANYDSFIQHQ